MHCIGELRTEQLDIAPAQLRVRVTRRPRYACRSCEEAIVVAEAPARPIDGGMPTEALIVHVVVSKFCDSLPLYRQSQMLARQQDPRGDGTGWTFRMKEHGGDYPDNMPQAIVATDAEGRSCTYVPVRVRATRARGGGVGADLRRAGRVRVALTRVDRAK